MNRRDFIGAGLAVSTLPFIAPAFAEETAPSAVSLVPQTQESASVLTLTMLTHEMARLVDGLLDDHGIRRQPRGANQMNCVDGSFYADDLKCSLGEFSERFLRPAANALASSIPANAAVTFEQMADQNLGGMGVIARYGQTQIGSRMVFDIVEDLIRIRFDLPWQDGAIS